MLFLLPVLVGCSPDLTPTAAYDPIWIEPAPDDTVHGFQTWQVFGPKWEKNFDDRYYVCSVVTEILGPQIPCDAEPDCAWAWDVDVSVLETDCADAALPEDPLFV